MQSTVGVEAPVAEVPVAETEVMMDQDPPIDPSVDSAPHGREPGLPVSTRTGGVTSTPQLGPASPAATQEIVPVRFPIFVLMSMLWMSTLLLILVNSCIYRPCSCFLAAIVSLNKNCAVWFFQRLSVVKRMACCYMGVSIMTWVCFFPMQAEVEPLEDTTSVRTSQDPQADSVEAPAPVAPRPPPMTTQEIAAYRSGEDPDFDPVERRGWWEVNLAAGGCHPSPFLNPCLLFVSAT